MNDKQLSLVLVGLIAFVAGGFLFMLLRSEPDVDSFKRVTDVRAETLAGHMGHSPKAEKRKKRPRLGSFLRLLTASRVKLSRCGRIFVELITAILHAKRFRWRTVGLRMAPLFCGSWIFLKGTPELPSGRGGFT